MKISVWSFPHLYHVAPVKMLAYRYVILWQKKWGWAIYDSDPHAINYRSTLFFDKLHFLWDQKDIVRFRFKGIHLFACPNK